MYRITAIIILAILALSAQSATPLRRSARLLSKNTPKSPVVSSVVHQAVTSDVESDDDGAAFVQSIGLPSAEVSVVDTEHGPSVVTPSSTKFSVIKISAIIALLASIAFGMRATLM